MLANDSISEYLILHDLLFGSTILINFKNFYAFSYFLNALATTCAHSKAFILIMSIWSTIKACQI